jgi:transcriptional regulator BetI-like protein
MRSSVSAQRLPGRGTPTDQLRAHLTALKHLITHEAQLCGVMAELTLRATRDAGLRERMREMDRRWHTSLRTLIRRYSSASSNSLEVDAETAAALTIAAIKGLSLPMEEHFRAKLADAAFTQLLRMLGLQA